MENSFVPAGPIYLQMKELMAAIALTGNGFNKSEREYTRKFGQVIGRVQHISIITRIDVFYTKCCLGTQIVASTLPVFKVSRYA